MLTEIERLENEIAAKQAEVERLKREAADAADPIKALAIELHNVMCKINHTDGCSWHYEIQKGVHNWTSYAHAHWAKKAYLLSEKCNTLGIETKQVFEIHKILNTL